MELAAISGTQSVTTIRPKPGSEVPTAPAANKPDRVRDDAYKQSGQEPHRGMEEEQADLIDDEDPDTEGRSDLPQSAPASAVNLLA